MPSSQGSVRPVKQELGPCVVGNRDKHPGEQELINLVAKKCSDLVSVWSVHEKITRIQLVWGLESKNHMC